MNSLHAILGLAALLAVLGHVYLRDEFDIWMRSLLIGFVVASAFFFFLLIVGAPSEDAMWLLAVAFCFLYASVTALLTAGMIATFVYLKDRLTR